jgi:hypothetical protein
MFSFKTTLQRFPTIRVAVTCILLLAATAVVYAQQPSTTGADAATRIDQKLIAEGRDGSEIMKNLTYLSDEIGPRLTGSANLKRANDWAAEKMKSYGLTNVQLEPWTLPVGWRRGTVNARLLEPDNGRSLHMASAGWSPGTKGKIEGRLVVIRQPSELSKHRGNLKGAIVLAGDPAEILPITEVASRGDGFTPGPAGTRDRRRPPAPPVDTAAKPGDKPKDGNTSPADSNSDRNAKPQDAKPDATPTDRSNPRPRPDGARFSRRFFGREFVDSLTAEGAALMLTDSGKPQGLLVTTGSWRGVDRVDAPEPLPQLFVAHEHFALLHRLASRESPARVEIEVTNTFVPGPIVVYNTVGEIKGSEKPDEFVVLGAHIDSWDLAQGTTDNGTGTCIVLEAARILNKCGVKPKRTIRFCLFSGEEQGLHGSREYTKTHKDEMPKTSMCLVHDAGTGKVNGVGVLGRPILKPILETQLASIKELGISEIFARGMSGSDHQAFENVGVPGLMLSQDMTEYRFTHHTQTDTLDKANAANLIQGAQIMAVAAVRIANMDELLPREKMERERREP